MWPQLVFRLKWIQQYLLSTYVSDCLLGPQGMSVNKNHGTWPLPNSYHGMIRNYVKGLIGIIEFNLHLSVKMGDPEIKWLAQGYTANNWHCKGHTLKLFTGSYSSAPWFEMGKLLTPLYTWADWGPETHMTSLNYVYRKW